MIKTVHDPRIPAPDSCMLIKVLTRHASERPDSTFAVFEDETRWTYSETLDQVRRAAAALAALGVKPGDYVGMWLPNSAEAVRLWFAVNYLGAVFVPLNLAYRGALLEHCIQTAKMRLLIAHADLVPRLNDIDTGSLTDVLVLGGEPPAHPRLTMHAVDALTATNATPEPADVAPWDTQLVIYTSGTTGPSNAVLLSYLHVFTGSEATFGYTSASDRFLANLPLFHVTGMAMVMRTVLTGGSLAMVSAFNTHDFWDVAVRTESTSVLLMGVMATFLMKQSASASERQHRVRTALIVPLSVDSVAFSQRFGCEVYTAFAMSEITTPLFAGPNPQPIGTSGKPRAGVEIRLVDVNDCEVAPGDVGELIIRTDRPWSMTHGYLRNPEATAAAWRNGWFHTGDGFRKDENGNYFFVDRMKDAIRRRGENISSFELEAEICTHQLVQEAAVVAVPSEIGEDEVLAVIATLPGTDLEPAELIEYLVPRLPYFMVPRYIRMVESLPKTPTQKVQKHLLREQGLTEGVYDREAEGVLIKRDPIVRL